MDLFSYELGKKAGGGGTPATLIDKNINANGTYNASSDEADGYKKVVVEVAPNLQNKNITISTNTTTTIEKDNGYDGLGTVSVTTNVPAGIDWSAIGYSLQPEFITNGFNHAKQVYDNWNTATTDMTQMFKYDYDLTFMPDVNSVNVTNMKQAFGGNNYINYIIMTHLTNVTNLSSVAINCKGLIYAKLNNANNVTTLSDAFYNNTTLVEVDLSGIQIANNCNLNYLFNSCPSLAKVDISGMDFSNFTGSMNNAFDNQNNNYCKQSKGAYADGIPYVYVKDATAQSYILNKASSWGINNWTTDNVVIKQS